MNATPKQNVNFGTLAVQLTPTTLRKPVLTGLLHALMAPFRRLGANHAAFQDSKKLRMAHNGQVRLLERIANLLTIGSYDPQNPAIRLDEPLPVEEFLVSPNGNWALQNSIHHDRKAKDNWDYHNGNPPETPERFGLLHDGSAHAASLGFEVHLAPSLAQTAPANQLKAAFLRNGGKPALRGIVDTYKLAGKQYTIIED